MSNVYAPLQSYLSEHRDSSVILTYGEIERLLGRKLPPTAYGQHKRQWWANTETHSQALAWLRASRRAQLDVNNQRVTFSREQSPAPVSRTAEPTDEIRLSGLEASALRMLQDVAEERSISVSEAATALLNASALRRRSSTLDWFAANTVQSPVSGVDLIRADRDAR